MPEKVGVLSLLLGITSEIEPLLALHASGVCGIELDRHVQGFVHLGLWDPLGLGLSLTSLGL